MRVLVGCEFSGTVRRAFRAAGHDAWSYDLLPAEDDSPYHIIADVRQALDGGWDLAIFHPPCTHLAVSGARWFRGKGLWALPGGFVERRCTAERRIPLVSEGSLDEFRRLLKSFGETDKDGKRRRLPAPSVPGIGRKR